jgi:hypothetical protein
MQKIVLTFGVISGVIMAGMMILTMALMKRGDFINFDNGEIIGYSSMVLAFILVFFGIRSYRENVGGGRISFGKAFQVGILVTLISCAFYVGTWEILYYNFVPDFGDKYAAHQIDRMRARGATQAQIDATRAEMERFKKMYTNPAVNAGMTFLEVFPVGLVITLVSAAILRRRTQVQPA